MKNIRKLYMATALTATLLASTAQAGSFNGFYAGISVGGTQKDVKAKADLKTQAEFTRPALPRATIKEEVNLSWKEGKESNEGLFYGFLAGYGTTMASNIYIGSEITVSHNTVNKFHTLSFKSAKSGDAEVNLVNTPSLEVKYERGPSIGFSPRIGYVLNKDVLLFAKFGIEGSRDKLEVRTNNKKQSLAKKTKVSFVPGLGIEMALDKNWSTRLDYEYSFGSKIKGSKKEKDEELRTVGSYTSHALKIGLSYRF